ncbi:hypothetical protein D3C87_176760 [compost metagenome]
MKLSTLVLKAALIMGISLGVITPANAALDFLEPAFLKERVRKEVAKASIRGSLNLVDVEIYNGISASIRYRLESEPSYIEGYYTRLDRYLLSASISPGDILEDNDSPIGFSVNKDTEVIFARQFKSQGQSLTAMPYTLKHIPLSAKNAIENLQPGDFVALQADLSVVFSVGASSSLSSVLDMKGSTHVFVSGEFLVHLYRMADNKMRVKLIAVRKKGTGASAGITLSNFKIIGLKVIDRQLKRWTHFDPISIKFERALSDLFMLDYIFDLNNPQAALAYNELLTKKTRFKDFSVINPLQPESEMRKELLTDLSDIEDITHEDRTLPTEQRRINRVFRGANSADTSSARFRVGLSILKFESKTAYSQNKVIYYDQDNNENYYLLDTYLSRTDFSFFFNLYGDDVVSATNMLYSTNKSFAPERFVAMTLSTEMKMKDVSRNDFGKLQGQVRQVLPASEYAKIDWKSWATAESKVVNGYFKTELFFHPDSIKMLPTMNQKMATQLFTKYIEKTGIPSTPPRHPAPYDDQYSGRWQDRYQSDISWLAIYMTKAFNPNLPSEERYKAFKAMKDFGLWQEKGGGFLTSFLPEDRLVNLVSYQMILSGRDADTVTYKYGNFAEEALYRSLMYIQNIINDRSFDLRSYTDDNGNPIRIN